MPVAGIVDVLNPTRSCSGYLPGPNDVYVSCNRSSSAVRKGDAVHGAIRAPREGEPPNQRQKSVPLQSIDSINGMSVEESTADRSASFTLPARRSDLQTTAEQAHRPYHGHRLLEWQGTAH